jgi:hypothetical protein
MSPLLELDLMRRKNIYDDELIPKISLEPLLKRLCQISFLIGGFQADYRIDCVGM